MRRYLALLRAAVAEHKLLRLVLAQKHQIACRDMGRGDCNRRFFSHPRQTGSFADLVSIAARPDEEQNFWA